MKDKEQLRERAGASGVSSDINKYILLLIIVIFYVFL